jgi:hypothetical protein
LFREGADFIRVAARHGHSLVAELRQMALGDGKTGLEIVTAGGEIDGFRLFLEHE